MKLITLLLLAFILVSRSQAAIWVVNQNGTGNFLTIQSAINSPTVQSGDTIFLAPSNHFEQGIANSTKSLTYLGSGYDASIIHGGGFTLTNGVHRFSGLHIDGSINATLCDSLKLESVELAGAVLSDNCYHTDIIGCRIGGTVTHPSNAITGSTFKLQRCRTSGVSVSNAAATITQNVVDGTNNLVSLSANGSSAISNNVLRHASGNLVSIIELSNTSSYAIVVTNNVLYYTQSAQRYAISAGNSTAYIFNNILREGGFLPIRDVGPSTAVGYNSVFNMLGGMPGPGNIGGDPRFVEFNTSDPPDSLDFHLLSISPCINTGNPDAQYNDLDGSRNDMGVYGGVGPIGSIPIVVEPPNYPAVTNLSLFPVIVPGNGTIEIRATGRIGR